MAKKWMNKLVTPDLAEITLFDEDKKADADKDKAEKKVKTKKDEIVSQHLCAHSAGVDSDPESEWYDCRTDARAEYEEFTKKDDTVVLRPAVS